MRSHCSPDREQEGKDTFFDFGGRFLDRRCSFSLVLFPSAIYSCQGDLATCFTCLHQSPVYTSQKQAKKAHVVLRTLAFKHACSLMSCSTPACIICMSSYANHRVGDFYCRFEVRTNATAIVSLVKRILFLLFWERRRNRQSSSRSYLHSLQLRRPRPARRSTKHKTTRPLARSGSGTKSLAKMALAHVDRMVQRRM